MDYMSKEKEKEEGWLSSKTESMQQFKDIKKMKNSDKQQKSPKKQTNKNQQKTNNLHQKNKKNNPPPKKNWNINSMERNRKNRY